MSAKSPGKPRLVVELLYTFGTIVMIASTIPVGLLIVFSTIAALAGWQVDDGTAMNTMKNALVLTEVLLAMGIPLVVAGYVVSLHPPTPPVTHKNGGTHTTPVQVPPTRD